MKTLILSVLFLSTTCFLTNNVRRLEESESKGLAVKCLWFKDYRIYNLFPLQNELKHSLGEKGQINYNICSNTEKKCGTGDSRFVYWKDDNSCASLSGKFDLNSTFSLSVNEGEDMYEKGIRVVLPPGDPVSEGSSDRYQVTIELKCEKEGKADKVFSFDNVDFKKGKKDITATGTSIYACPEKGMINAIKAINESKYISLSILIVIGLLLCYFGLKLYKGTLMLVCVSSVMIIGYAVILPLLPQDSEGAHTTVYIVMAICFVSGLLIGYLVINLHKFVLCLIGILAAALMGDLFLVFVAWFINVSPIIAWLSRIVLIAFGGALGYWLADYAVILGTVMIGTYFTIFSITFLFNMPLKIIIELSENGEYEQIHEMFGIGLWVILAISMVIGFGGLYYQIRTKAGVKDDEKKETERVLIL